MIENTPLVHYARGACQALSILFDPSVSQQSKSAYVISFIIIIYFCYFMVFDYNRWVYLLTLTLLTVLFIFTYLSFYLLTYFRYQ